ncbi:lysophospholipid acyltransferase family protein [Paenibacillus radicis (ex Gao et al. 2016)]|uniref:Glycerol acyltransferase n=1 Tax=Paenibacillus radicis (ex Gao et al. 2016) TaxID=1737354 RepID=A0A917M002_9BACL|nr:lysophospholipid acyltransferase family protein [Paenibacillus radicis (ex Gao et al. 2016)]GGG68896.1 glycerol acyltransferase [Paenibacillus radicis (ex Gao et al. 2016)]
MISARKSKWFEKLLGRYNENYLLRRHFHRLAIRGNIEAADLERPVVFIMNHSSWWDGLLVYQAARMAGQQRHYFMMDEKQLSRYRFFSRAGAFSIDKESLRGIQQSLRYAVDLLKSGNSVWVYPQGDIYHLETRPIVFQSGIGYMLEGCPHALVQPVTAYYTMGQNQKPDVTLWFGEPVHRDWRAIGRKEIASELRELLEKQLNDHRSQSIAAIDRPLEGFRTLINGTRSTSEAFDTFKRRAARWFSFSGQ